MKSQRHITLSTKKCAYSSIHLMHIVRYLTILLILLLSSYSLCWANETLSCASQKCHPDIFSNNNYHPSDADCTSCHSQNKTAHPDVQEKNFTLKDETCLSCHEKLVDFDYLHSPVASGNCGECHTPHGKKENNYLHDQKNIICYNCHNHVASKDDTILHGGIGEEKCSSCHTVHGSFYPNLLRANYSTNFFNDYSDKTYELCFRCHKIDLLMHPKTSYNTKFRDGKRNLHYLHVNKRIKGRSCKSCHKTHAASLPHLMASSIAFGNWTMPINFEPTESGGKCSPGCHAPKEYSRKRR